MRHTIMTRTIQGTAHGNTIQLNEDLGLAEGQQIEVRVTVLPSPRVWGEGLRRCAGALADDPEWDAIMNEVHESRKLERRPMAEEE
jgi:hypothetical protein